MDNAPVELAPEERKQLREQKYHERGELSVLKDLLSKYGFLDISGVSERLEQKVADVDNSISFFSCEPPKAVAVAHFEPKAMSEIRESFKDCLPRHKEGRKFKNTHLARLFQVDRNTISNWIRGIKGPPSGFLAAYESGDEAAMREIAERYRASRDFADVYSKKKTVSGLTEEQIDRFRKK